MNKVLVIGRIVRDPDTHETSSGVKYTRFTIAVNRIYGENQTDFIPMVAWRSQAEFIEKYLNKGSLVSIEGRFTSSSYTNDNGQQVVRYEVTVDRVESLETKSQREFRENNTNEISLGNRNQNSSSTQVMKMSKESAHDEEVSKDIPWELDL